jgi:hypothetical protein
LHFRLIHVLVLCISSLLLGCSALRHDDVLARVGKRELTRAAAAEIAGQPFDSLTVVEQWRVISGWTAATLFRLEGERQHLDRDPELRARLAAVEGELIRSRLMAAEPAVPIADSTIERYYAAHRSEFLRTGDSYLLDLYWSQDPRSLEQFTKALARGDSGQLRSGEVSSLGKWLADRRELEPALAAELEQLSAGAYARPQATDDGYRIMRLVETYAAGEVLDLSVVKGEIRDRLTVEQGHAREDSLVAKLKARWPVEVYLKEDAETPKR